MDINGPHEDLDEDGYCDVCMWVLGEYKHVTYTVLTEAKCNEVGVKQCVCGEFIIIPKTDHQWSAVDCKSNYSCLICSVTKDMDKNGPHADENNDGLCEVCNMIIGEHIHTYDVVRFEPTCFDFGEVQCKCRNDVFRVLPPLGHDFVNYACSRCDYISFLIRIQTYTGEFIEIYDEVKYGTTWNEWVSSYNSSDDIEEDVFYFSDTIDDLYYKVDGGLCSIYKDSASSHPVDGGLIYPGTYEATLTYFCYVDDVMHSFRYNTNTWESLNRHDVSTGREFLVHSDDPNAVVRLKTGEYLFDSAGNVCYYSDKIKAGERYVSGYLLSIDYRYGSGESEVLHIEEPIVPGTTWTEWAALYNETHKGPDGEGVIINNYGYVCFSEPGCSVVDGNGDPVLFNV